MAERGGGRSRVSGLAIAVATLCAGLVLFVPAALRAEGTSGTAFWLAFPANGASGSLSLQILGASGTAGSVDVSGLGFSAPFEIPAAGLAVVGLPAAAMLSASDGVEDLAVHVTADRAVVVYGLDVHGESADSYLALPVAALGTSYEVVSYTPQMPFESQLAVVAAAALATQVVVTPTAAIGSHPAGAPFLVPLGPGQVYQARSAGDLTGTAIQADQPVAVFSGSPWANVPVGLPFADHLAEQLLPRAAWGTEAFLLPSALRSTPERLRIQVRFPNTAVTMSPGGEVLLSPGSSFEASFTTPVRLASDQPFSVSHFTPGSSDDGVGDPFLLVPLAVEHFAHCHLLATADDGTTFPDNFANVVVPAAAVGQIRLDGIALPAGGFTPIDATGFSYRQVPLTPGRHRLSGPLAFGASIYGFGSSVSYASPAGGASPPFPDGLGECHEVPEPSATGLGIAVAVTLARLTRSRAAAPRSPTAPGVARRAAPRSRSAPSRR